MLKVTFKGYVGQKGASLYRQKYLSEASGVRVSLQGFNIQETASPASHT